MAPFGERPRREADTAARGVARPEDSPWVRAAVDALPRHLFAADRPGRPGTTAPPCPRTVVDLLDSLRLKPGHRVLELGTGSGWTAALLAHRAGPGRVTSVEADPGRAAAARRRLAAAGAGPAVEVADSAAGWPRGAPYDRVVSARAVDRVPWAWVAQTRPGGRIVTPWGRLGHVALTVAADGRSASGWVQGAACRTPARAEDTGSDGFARVRGAGPAAGERPWSRDPAALREDRHLRFALSVALPGVRVTVAAAGHGTGARLHDGVSSWATLSTLPDATALAAQGGPRRLADELELAWDGWLEAGSPDLYEFGLTVESEELQYAWALDQETGPRWLLPAPADPGAAPGDGPSPDDPAGRRRR
ncbi:methyltransferase domain-containing protein [Streptomyces sp. NPDC001985]|uniref:methyltransferase domain-containing protein n=1 Tax=Streptomyces sp. NPDC001985 TaxID=3154406 RepID=UPI0033188F32